MTDNPYAPPTAAIDDRSIPAAPIRMYSPTQVAAGALLGGPVGLVYFLQANFEALGDDRRRKMTLLGGAALIVALVAVVPVLPDKFPSSPFTIAYIVIARQVSEKLQMTKQAIAASSRHDFHSGGRVFGVGLLCLVGSVVVIMVPLMLLLALGVWNPE